MKNYNYQRIIFFCFCLFIIFFRSFSYVYQHQEKFFSRSYEARFEKLKQSYSHSQYAQKKNPEIITDEQFEAFAGGAFLRGLSPILIVHDHPPLGRYLVSLSILIFDNENTIILFLSAFSYLGIFLLARLLLKNNFLSLVPLLIIANEPLFFNKLVYTPLPEPILLPFVVFALYFFIRAIESKKYVGWMIATSLCLGAIISIRFFVLGLVLTAVMLAYLIFQKNKQKLIIFITTLPLMLVVLELSYFRVIQLGASFLKVISIQKYILSYHKSAFVVPFTYWDLLFFNRWHTWWGNNAILSDPQWIPAWPLSMAITLVYGLLGLLRKIRLSKPEQILSGWVVAYSLMLSVGYSSTRYFLPLLPFVYILATSYIVHIFFLRFFSQKRNKIAILKTTKNEYQ